jgi:hypothetical protein
LASEVHSGSGTMNSPSRWSLLVVFLLSFFLPRLARAQDAEPACSEDWKKNVYTGARDSVVSIETVGFAIEHFEPVAGIVYPDNRHVVAISHGAGIGRGLRVRFANGAEIAAEPVAFDEGRHVTILKLASEAPAPALRVVDKPLEVGKELLSVSPFEGVSMVNPEETALDSQIHVGHVANLGDRTLLRFDARWPETIGAPIFDCTGDVVALRGWGAILPAKDILAVTPKDEPVDMRRWSALHMHVGMIGQYDDRARIGASVGMSVVQGDRWQVRVAFGGVGDIPRPSERDRALDGERISGGRLQLEPTVGYRILLTKDFPTYLVPQVGVVGRLDFRKTTSTTATIPDTSCVARGGPCDVDTKTSSSTTVTPSIAPALGVAFMIPGASVGYQVHLDVRDPAKSTHQVFLGFEF